MSTAQAASDVQLKIASRPAFAGKNSDDTQSARSIPSVMQSDLAIRAAARSVVHASWSTANIQAFDRPRSYCRRAPGYMKRRDVQRPAAPAAESHAGEKAIEPGVPP